MNKQYCPYCMNPVAEGETCRSCGLTAGNYEPSQNHLPPGTILENRYLIGRVLGEGGFGITYIGCDTKLEMKVAIKEYYPAEKVQRISAVSLDLSVPSAHARAFFDAGKQRFLQEALIMAQMDKQPEIVGVRDFFECNNTAYIVMEFVEGTTFKQLVEQRGGGIPASELLPLVKPLFGALSNFHGKGLIHRDISPDNLMLERGAVRLLDFGCARQPERGDTTMTIVLKHGYAPIEQYTNRGQGPWTDVYALGATLYFCLVGKRPPQAMDRAVEDELILPRKLGVDLTEEQEQALMKAIGVKRSQRFASMEEFHAALYPPKPAPAPMALRLELNIRNVLKNSEDRGGFSYELVDSDGRVLKTASTDPHGHTRFVLTFGPETAGYSYTYTIRQVDPQRPDVVVSAETYTLTILIRVRDGRLCADLQMKGMPVTEEQVYVFHNVLKKKDPKKEREERQKHKETEKRKTKPAWMETALVLGVALAVIGAIILMPFLKDKPAEEVQQPVLEAAGSEQTDLPMDSETVELPSIDVEAIFADARIFADGNGSLLGEFLRTGRGQAIALTQGHYYLDPTVVQKISDPLLVEAGALLCLEDPVVLEAPLVVRGELQLRSTLTVVGDGQLILEEDSYVNGDGLVLMDDLNEGVFGRRAPSMENGIRYVSMSHEVVTGEPIHVRTEEELRETMHNGVLVVDDHITLTEGLDVSYTLIIAEGASVTGSLDEENWLHLTPRAKLINYGTVSCCVNSDSGELGTSQNLIYNEGEMNCRFYLTGNTNVVNRGNMQWLGAQMFNQTRLYNEGNLEVPERQWGGILQGALLVNTGGMVNWGHLEQGGQLRNRGTLIMEQSSGMRNFGHLLNQVSFQLKPNADLDNAGIVELAGSMVWEENGELWNNGIFHLNDWGLETLQAHRDLPGKVIHVVDDSAGQNIWEVTTSEEFYGAVKNAEVDTIIVDNQVGITGEMTVNKNICINPGASLVSDSLLKIGGVVHNYGSLRAQKLWVEADGQISNSGDIQVAKMLNLENNSGILNCGEINLQDCALTMSGAALLNYGNLTGVSSLLLTDAVVAQYGMLDAPNADVELKNGGLMMLGGNYRHEGWNLTIRDAGRLNLCSNVALEGMQINLDQGAMLQSYFAEVLLTADSRLRNSGFIETHGYDEMVFYSAGEIENYGRIWLHVPMELQRGYLNNQGVVEMDAHVELRENGGDFFGNNLQIVQ